MTDKYIWDRRLEKYVKAEKYQKFNRLYHVYILLQNSKIVYVGCTENVLNRLKNHKYNKEFNSYFVIYSSLYRDEALEMESKLIQFFKYVSSIDLINIRKGEVNFNITINEY